MYGSNQRNCKFSFFLTRSLICDAFDEGLPAMVFPQDQGWYQAIFIQTAGSDKFIIFVFAPVPTNLIPETNLGSLFKREVGEGIEKRPLVHKVGYLPF